MHTAQSRIETSVQKYEGLADLGSAAGDSDICPGLLGVAALVTFVRPAVVNRNPLSVSALPTGETFKSKAAGEMAVEPWSDLVTAM